MTKVDPTTVGSPASLGELARRGFFVLWLHGHLLANVFVVGATQGHALFFKVLLAMFKGGRGLYKVALEPCSARAAFIGSLKKNLI